MNPADLATLGEAMHRELGREYYLTGAGLKEEPTFQAIYDRYAALFGDDALEAARGSGVRALYEWLVDIRVGRRVAALEEQQLRWEQAARVRLNGEELPYLRVPIQLANESDRERRRALDSARGRLVAAELNPLRRQRFASEHAAFERLGFPDYVTGICELSGIDLDALWQAANLFLRDSESMYREVLTRLAQRRLGMAVADLTRADVGWAFRAQDYDDAFRLDDLVDLAQRQMGEMGIDARQGGRIRLDTEERAGKRPRAFCAPVRVPEEVYLVLRPKGGHGDYRTLWHELGHAIHFASVDPALPFADRWVGDNSVTEGFAMLWDHLTLDAGWLSRYGGLPRRHVSDLRFDLLVHELFGIRRYAAKLAYEITLHRRKLADVAAEYAERLSAATLFRFAESDYLADVDPGFYAARYLRAWQLEAALSDALTRQFDEDWFRNPRAGPFIQDLMSRGQRDPADRLAVEVTGSPLSFGPLLTRLETALR